MLCFLFHNYNFYSAFASVSFEMLEFEAGSIIRSFHVTITSCIYILLYLHILKVAYLALAFDSSFLVWTIGFILFFMLIIISFLGYILPLSSLAYWGLTVISNVLSIIPMLGNLIVFWLWGCEYINDYTLVKIHTLHIVIPLIMIGIILLHLLGLHYFISSDASERFVFYIERILVLFSRLTNIIIYNINIKLCRLLNMTFRVTWRIICASWCSKNTWKDHSGVIFVVEKHLRKWVLGVLG